MNDIDIILSDLKNCKRLHDPGTPKDRGTDQPVFRTDEQKLAIVQSLQVEDIIFHKALPNNEYPLSYKLGFRRRFGKVEVEVWFEIELYLAKDSHSPAVADISFYRIRQEGETENESG